MKTLIKLTAVVLCFGVSTAFAASDYYLQIKDSKTDSAPRLVKCPDGACTITGLSVDTYSLALVDASGKPLDNSKLECAVTSPRDAASGMATGKRMHKPFTISKEMRSAQLVTTEGESSVTLACVSPTEPAAAAKAAGYDLKKATK